MIPPRSLYQRSLYIYIYIYIIITYVYHTLNMATTQSTQHIGLNAATSIPSHQPGAVACPFHEVFPFELGHLWSPHFHSSCHSDLLDCGFRCRSVDSDIFWSRPGRLPCRRLILSTGDRLRFLSFFSLSISLDFVSSFFLCLSSSRWAELCPFN